MGGGKKRKDAAVRIDGSVPFAFLLGKRYSGYKQAINSSRDLKVLLYMPTTVVLIIQLLIQENDKTHVRQIIGSPRGFHGATPPGQFGLVCSF